MERCFKRIAALLLAVTLLAAAACSGCVMGKAGFYAKFPPGFTAKEEHFDPEAFQDSVDYCKYLYESAEGFENDFRFLPVSEAGVEKVRGYFENFREWMETCGRLSEYDFSSDVISDSDYVRIESNPHFTDYDDYSVWFFDTESCTLYYVHANI